MEQRKRSKGGTLLISRKFTDRTETLLLDTGDIFFFFLNSTKVLIYLPNALQPNTHTLAHSPLPWRAVTSSCPPFGVTLSALGQVIYEICTVSYVKCFSPSASPLFHTFIIDIDASADNAAGASPTSVLCLAYSINLLIQNCL